MSQTENMIQNVIASIDAGNGYLKAIINNIVRDYPSVAVKQFNLGHILPLTTSEDIAFFMSDIINQMDLSFSSPLVQSTERRLFGERALKSGLNLEEYDVFSRTSKAEVDLSGVLALGTIAADRLYDYYEEYKMLPSNGCIQAYVTLTTALPISEYKRHALSYKQKFENNGQPHTITFHNFEHPVRVELVFSKVKVINEGESAQYGLKYGKEPFLNMIQKEASKRFPNGELNGITGKDLVTAKNTLGIDIGEGTIDFAVFTNGRFNSDASSTMNQGYGAVLESTLSLLQEEGYPYKSRKELSEFLHSEPSPFTRDKWNHVKEINQSEEYRFGDIVAAEVSKVFSRVGGFIEVIFVFGGGATPLEWSLFGKLQSRVAEFGTNNLIPIVYLESSFSRYLNAQGLHQVALLLESE